MTDFGMVIELDYYGDELNAVFYKGGKVYIYPMDEVESVVNKLRSAGVEVIDKTVYSQEEEMTYEEYKERYGEPEY